jgi:hypothetical protein
MKPSIWLSIGLALAAASSFALQTPGDAAEAPLRLEAGTPVKLRLKQTISSAALHVNDRVDFAVSEDVKVNSIVIIPKGNPAWGTVIEAAPRGRMARDGRLHVNIEAVCRSDGEKAALRAVQDVHAGEVKASNEGFAESLFAFPAWPIMLFQYGKDITIPKDTVITAYINEDLSLDPVKFRDKARIGTCDSPTKPAPAPLLEFSTITVRSVPSDGEIRVDGKYVGNTPSTLRLLPGEHKISIVVSGQQAWERTIAVTPGGDVMISATLESTERR